MVVKAEMLIQSKFCYRVFLLKGESLWREVKSETLEISFKLT